MPVANTGGDIIIISSSIPHPQSGWGTTVDFTASFLHSSRFSAFRSMIFHSRPVHSLMLSSHRFLCLSRYGPPKLAGRYMCTQEELITSESYLVIRFQIPVTYQNFPFFSLQTGANVCPLRSVRRPECLLHTTIWTHATDHGKNRSRAFALFASFR